MRFSTVAAAAFAAAPAVVSAGGSMGFALGTKMPNGACKTQADYEADLDAIHKAAPQATVVRGYAAADCKFAELALAAAKKKNFKVMLGIWPDVDDSYRNDLNAIVGVAKNYQDTIYAVTVGSETLYRGNFTGETLKEKIVDVKSKLPSGIKVGTADSWNKFDDGTGDALIGTADILLINAFAFWQGADLKTNATQIYLNDMYKAITHIESKANGKMPEVWNGETGWPTAEGTDFDASKGGKDNAAYFYKNGFCALIDWGFNAFFFEAFDEPWKPKTVGDNGKLTDETTWGAMTADRQPKYDLQC